MLDFTIVVIIPTHNRPETFSQCLNNISSIIDNDRFKFLLVLDGCDDETWKIAKSIESPNILICEGDGNLFWGGAMALGMCKAFNELKADAVLWLNDDSIFQARDIVKIAYSHLQHTNAIIGAKLIAKNLDNLPIYPQVEIKKYGLLKVPYLNGNFTLIPGVVYEKIGNIDSKRFPHFADSPFLEKARQYGFECFVDENITVGIHYDILRHLPLYLQILCFQGNWFEFYKQKLLSKTSKWFIPFRWYCTKEKFNNATLLAFSFIILRDFLPVITVTPLCLLSSKYRRVLTLWIAKSLLNLPNLKIQELERELEWM